MAMTKLRARRTPSNQAHVTNRLDDPLLLAADAATAAAFGFREIETTVPVLADAPSNAVACLIGAAVGAPGVLVQCSVEEALELELGMRGLTSYAETVSLYGTEQVFVDGDDTPWSKAFLTSAYAVAGHEDAGHVRRRRRGADGRRRGPVDALPRVALRRAGPRDGRPGRAERRHRRRRASPARCPAGVRELMAENLMVMLRDLESCSGNDALMSESDMRRTSRTLPIFLAGSDFIFSGFGSIQRYDNMFGPSNFNAEDIDDFLAMQRDWGVDGGLRTVPEAQIARAAPARGAGVPRRLPRSSGWPTSPTTTSSRRSTRRAPRTWAPPDPLAVLSAAHAIREGGLTMLDVVARAGRERVRGRGGADAGHDPGPGRRRLPADRGDLRRADERAVAGHRPQRLRRARAPATSPTPQRQREIDAIRQQRSGSRTCAPSRRRSAAAAARA